MQPHHFVKRNCELITCASPFSDTLEPENGHAEYCGVEVLMSNGVPPIVQLPQTILTALISKIQTSYFVPKGESEAIEIRADVSGIWVPFVQFPVQHDHVPKCGAQKTGRDALHEVVCTLRVQVPAKPLEL